MNNASSEIQLTQNPSLTNSLGLCGDLTRDTIPRFWNQRKEWLTAETFSQQQMRLDLSAVKKVDSSALAMLLLLINKVDKIGCCLVLTSIPTSLIKLLNISQAKAAFADHLEQEIS